MMSRDLSLRRFSKRDGQVIKWVLFIFNDYSLIEIQIIYNKKVSFYIKRKIYPLKPTIDMT